MSRSSTSLDAVAEAEFGTVGVADLQAALLASGPQAGAHLASFVDRVRVWLHRSDRGEPLERRAWVLQVVDRFLRSLGNQLGPTIATCGDEISQAALVRKLAETGAREVLGEAALEVVRSLVAVAPATEPPDPERWVEATLQLVETVGHVPKRRKPSPVEIYCELFGAAPAWLLKAVFGGSGRLLRIDYYKACLGRALAECPAAADAFAAAFAKGGSQRLADIYHDAVTSLSGSCGQSPMANGTHAANIAELVESFRAQDPELGHYAENLGSAWADHDAEMQGIFSRYLAGQPSNHEDVVDFCSFSGSALPERPLAEWGLPQVVTATSSSMLTSAGRERPRWFGKPDFDAREVLLQVGVDACVWLVLQQKTPRYSLQYLQMLSRPPHMDWSDIAVRVAADPGFVARLRRARGIEAAAVLDKLDSLRRRADSFEQLFRELFPSLLPEQPWLLGNHIEWAGDDELREVLVQESCRRLASQPTLRDLSTLVDEVRNGGLLPLDELGEALERLDVSLYLPPAIAQAGQGAEPDAAPDEPFRGWVRDVTDDHVVDRLLPRVLESLDSARLIGVLTWAHEAASTELSHMDQLARKRVRLRNRVFEALETRADLPTELGSLVDGAFYDACNALRMDSAEVSRWFSVVGRICEEAFAENVVCLLGFAASFAWQGGSLATARAVVDDALQSASASTLADVRERFEKALRDSSPQTFGAEELAELGTLSLPGQPADLVGIRAFTLERLSDISGTLPSLRARQALREVVERDHPGLLGQMPDWMGSPSR